MLQSKRNRLGRPGGPGQGFWRSWHASYNLWLVRYLYVPLGGSRHRALAVWPVFTFVAAWHDLEWRLLAWAWLSCLLFAPELVCSPPQPPPPPPGRAAAGREGL